MTTQNRSSNTGLTGTRREEYESFDRALTLPGAGISIKRQATLRAEKLKSLEDQQGVHDQNVAALRDHFKHVTPPPGSTLDVHLSKAIDAIQKERKPRRESMRSFLVNFGFTANMGGVIGANYLLLNAAPKQGGLAHVLSSLSLGVVFGAIVWSLAIAIATQSKDLSPVVATQDMQEYLTQHDQDSIEMPSDSIPLSNMAKGS